MAEGRYVISRIGQILVVTLEGAAHAGILSAADRKSTRLNSSHRL